MFKVPHDIQSKASYVTNLLVSQGFLDLNDSLELSSHQLHNLSVNKNSSSSETLPHGSDQPADKGKVSFIIPMSIQEKAVKADRKFLKLLNTLLSAVNSDNSARDDMITEIDELRRKLDLSQTQIKKLNFKCGKYSTKLEAAYRINSELKDRITETEVENKTIIDELNKSRILHEKAKHEFEIELRKRDVEIGRLKQRILDPLSRRLNTGSWSGTISKSQIGNTVPNSEEDARPLIIPENRLPGGFSKILSSYSSIHKQPSTSLRKSPQIYQEPTSQQNNNTNDTREDPILIRTWQDTLVRELRLLAHDNSLLYSLINATRLALESIIKHGQVRVNQLQNNYKTTDYIFNTNGSKRTDFNIPSQNHKNNSEDNIEDVNMDSDTVLDSANNTNVKQINIPASEKLSYYDSDKRFSMDGKYHFEKLGYDVERLVTFENFIQMLNPSKSNNVKMASSFLVYNDNAKLSQRSGAELARVIEQAPVKRLYKTVESALYNLSLLVHDPSLVSAEELKKKDEEIVYLKENLQKSKELWKNALDTMEKWKTYREERSENVEI